MARSPDTPEQRRLKAMRRRRLGFLRKHPYAGNRWIAGTVRGYDAAIAKLEEQVRAQGRKV